MTGYAMEAVQNFYNYVIEETIDPRTKDWFLVHSPVPLALITLCYCYIVFSWGPNYMKNREPYEFKTFIRFYNVFQIISNAAISYYAATSGWTTSFSFGCQPVDTSTTGEGYRMAVVVWYSYMIKIIDLLETVLYVLRKKDRQISVLHTYHHITTPLIAWMCAKWTPGGMMSLLMLLNCSVHVIMYTYYFMSAGGPLLQRLIKPIKPWITVIQMTQFCILLVHLSQAFIPSCNVPKAAFFFAVSNLFINLYLFYNFYKKNYSPKKVE